MPTWSLTLLACKAVTSCICPGCGAYTSFAVLTGAQAVAVLLLLPVLVSLRGLSLNELPQYVSDGAQSQPQGGMFMHHAQS